jgi:NPCBM/NEW2 domain
MFCWLWVYKKTSIGPLTSPTRSPTISTVICNFDRHCSNANSWLRTALLLWQTWVFYVWLATTTHAQEQYAKVLHLSDRILVDAQLTDFAASQWKFQIGPQEARSAQAASTAQAVESDQLVRWGAWSGVIGRQAVWLGDDSWLAGDLELSSSKSIRLQSRWLDLPEIPWSEVRGLVLSPVASLAEWIELESMLRSVEGERDVIWLRDRRQVSGVVDWSQLGTKADQLIIKVDQQQLNIPLVDVLAFVASPALIGPPSSNHRLQVGLIDGSLLNTVAIKSTQRGLSIQLGNLPKVESLDWSGQFCRSINYLSSVELENVQRLDALKYAAYKHLSDNQLDFPLGVNRDVYGKPLTALAKYPLARHQAGIIFHGLAMHSSAQVAYRWDRSPGKLLAEVRLADPTARLGNVQCKVMLARQTKLEEALQFSLQVDDISLASKLVEVDLRDAQLVVLVVEKALQGQYGDHVFWLDARIVKQR